MKSLQESLFNKDLIKRGVEINFDTLLNMLFDFGKKKKRMFDKMEIDYHEGKQSIFIRRFIDDSKRKDAVCFELVLGVYNTYIDKKLSPAFNIPVLKAKDSFKLEKPSLYNTYKVYNTYKEWMYSSSDLVGVYRTLKKKNDFIKDDSPFEITVNQDNIAELFTLYDKIVEYFCSDGFKKILQGYVDKFEFKHAIPGIVLDILMKKLVNEA